MNIFLVPYNWTRHVVLAIACGVGGFMAWWGFLHARVWLGPTLYDWGMLWSRGIEGPLFLGVVASTIAFVSIFAEHSLRRTGLIPRLLYSVIAGAIAFLGTGLGYGVIHGLEVLLAPEAMKEIVGDPSLTSHRHRLWQWLAAGFATGVATLAVRRGQGFFSHLGAGIVASGAAAALWQYLGYHILSDLYLASALAAFLWGALFGLLAWGIPKELYAGWIRVLSPYRYGYRVPVDKVEGGASERFVGHFPRGLDLFMPVEQGVAELHTSFVVDDEQRYTVRGLSVQPTFVKRMLEQVDIRYDSTRPAPLETDLQSEDRIVMSDGNQETEIEFLLLPREEQ